ncbi:hypothetical protein V8C86DRAFT_2510884, partial [Haematococcus lacustris]
MLVSQALAYVSWCALVAAAAARGACCWAAALYSFPPRVLLLSVPPLHPSKLCRIPSSYAGSMCCTLTRDRACYCSMQLRPGHCQIARVITRSDARPY